MTLSRRTVLGAGAAGALSAGLTPVPSFAGAASLPRRVDVVVVGAGISGLVTAWQIARAGRSVLVCEARDRVGGRVLNHRLSSGEVIESGGAFVGPTQDHVLALADELGVATFEEHADGLSVYTSSGPLGRLTYPGTVPPDPTILPGAAVVQTQLDQWAGELDVSAPWAHPRAGEWDSMTFHDFLARQPLNPAAVEQIVQCWMQPAFGADPDQVSLLAVLFVIACSGNEENKGTFERNSDTQDGAQERRFVGGSQLVPLRLAARLGSRVALGAAVSEIRQTGSGVVVRTARGPVACDRVVVACPPALARSIRYAPALPARRRALLEHLDLGQLMKCDAVYDRPFWRDAGLSGFGISDHGAVRAAFDNSPPDGTPGVLLAFVGGSTFRSVRGIGATARRQAVLRGFAEMFGDQALHPTEYVEHDWTKETWTRGAPIPVMAPGTLTRWGPTIRTPHGRVHWAGTETSTYWFGYMDGAVRAGERAASEVLRLP